MKLHHDGRDVDQGVFLLLDALDLLDSGYGYISNIMYLVGCMYIIT